MQDVVMAVIADQQGRFLLGKRCETKKSAPGFWSAIGGRVDGGEDERSALVRESMEETGLIVEPVEKICEFDSPDGFAKLHWWLVIVKSGEAKLANDEHTELRWFTIDEMSVVDRIFDEDLKIFKRIHASLNR